MKYLLLLSLLLPTPALAHDHYPGYICDELIVSLVEAVELEIITNKEAAEIIIECKNEAHWAE